MAAMLEEFQRDTPETDTDTHDDIDNGGNSSVDKIELNACAKGGVD